MYIDARSAIAVVFGSYGSYTVCNACDYFEDEGVEIFLWGERWVCRSVWGLARAEWEGTVGFGISWGD